MNQPQDPFAAPQPPRPGPVPSHGSQLPPPPGGPRPPAAPSPSSVPTGPLPAGPPPPPGWDAGTAPQPAPSGWGGGAVPPAIPPSGGGGGGGGGRRIPIWAWIVGGVFALVLVGGIIAAVSGGDDDRSARNDREETDETDEAGADETDPTTDGTTVPATAAVDTTPELPSTTAGAGITLPSTVPPATTLTTDPPPDTAAPAALDGELPGAPAGTIGTHDAPVPVGAVADIGGGWRLQVLEVLVDGAAAVAAENQFNDPPPPGSTFTLVTVALGYFGLDDPALAFLPTVGMIGAAGSELDKGCGVIPDELDVFGDVYAGGVLVGNACFITAPADFPAAQLYAQGDPFSFDSNDAVFLALAPSPAPGSVAPLAGLPGLHPESASYGARSAPNPIGTTADIGDGWSFTVTGPATDITDAVLAENQFNEAPPEGFRYAGLEVTYTYDGPDPTASAFLVSIDAVGSSNIALRGSCGVVAGAIDEFADVVPGGSVSGTTCVVVPADDLANGTWQLYAWAAFDEEYDYFAVQ